MKKNKKKKMRRNTWKERMLASIFLPMILAMIFISDAQSQGQVFKVKVLVEKTCWNGCGDPDVPDYWKPDIYFKITIGDIKLSSKDNQIWSSTECFDVDREFSAVVDVSQGTKWESKTIPVIIEQWDSDEDADDRCNIQPGEGRVLDLFLNLNTCQISGEANGFCDESIEVISSGEEDVYFKFKISIVDVADDLDVRCLHSPIWPEPDKEVRIRAHALDGDGALINYKVDDIEIWVDNVYDPAVSTSETSDTVVLNEFDFYYTPPTGADQIRYKCRVNDNGVWASSGWHIVQIGEPESGRSVPVLYTGPRDNRVDFVFIADKNTYTGPNDPDFLDHVYYAINFGYYAKSDDYRPGGLIFLKNQDAMNFWIALDTGEAIEYTPGCTTCKHVPPDGWSTAYSFADTGIIIQGKFNNDHAERANRINSSLNVNPEHFLHETGHAPFGLADEYCCNGGYYEAEPYPNIYNDQDDCLKDELADLATNTCEQISDDEGNSVGWFRVEGGSTHGNDLMECKGDFATNPADVRQINWKFDKCLDGEC